MQTWVNEGISRALKKFSKMHMVLIFAFYQIGYLEGEFKICGMQLPASVFEAIKWIAKWSNVQRRHEVWRNIQKYDIHSIVVF